MEEQNVNYRMRTQHKLDWWIGSLLGVWYIGNWSISFLIKLFMYQQNVISTSIEITSIIPSCLIFIGGSLILLVIIHRSLPMWIEIILLSSIILITFFISGMQSNFMQTLVLDSALKASCCKMLAIFYDSIILLLPMLWYVMRFKKKSPLEIRKVSYAIIFFSTPAIMMLLNLALSYVSNPFS